MYKPVKFMLALLCLQVVGFAGLNATKEAPLDYFDLKAGFEELQRHLNDKVNSDQLEENLNAARELVGCEAKTGCISSLLRQKPVESNLQKVARLFVRLLEVASQPDEKCNQQTLQYLADVAEAHSIDFPSGTGEGRVHFNVYGRVDVILDAQFDAILSKCELIFDEIYHQLEAKLNSKVKQQVHEIFTDEIMEKMPDTKPDQQSIMTRMAKNTDFENYKEALKWKESEIFEEYYKKFYRSRLTRPCKAYHEHFKSFTVPVKKIRSFCIKYGIPLNFSHNFNRSLALDDQCHYAGELATDGSLYFKAREIHRDYKLDIDDGIVRWHSDEERKGRGSRIY